MISPNQPQFYLCVNFTHGVDRLNYYVKLVMSKKNFAKLKL